MKSLILCLLIFNTVDNTTHTLTQTYIDNYKDLAIVEMHRTGIPASIKLAQAIIESSYGRSPFAQNSKNHFGLKCKSGWIGNKYYHVDDDLNEYGEAISSCFRSYELVIDSYVDHSNFLKNSVDYEDLFGQKTADYKSWAHALQKRGYATDPDYGNKIVRIIETYRLDQFDLL